MNRFLIASLAFFLAQFSFAQTQQDTLTLKLENYRGDIQWEQSLDKVRWSNVVGGNVSQIKTAASKTTYFRAKITENNCAPVYSNRKAIFVDDNNRIAATAIKGRIMLPLNASLDWNRYDVRSVIDSGKVQANGEFSIFATDFAQEDLLVVMDRNTQAVVMLAYFLGGQESYEISAESTALALLMMNPYGEIVADDKKQKLADAYKRSAEFKALLTEVEKSIANKKSLVDPANTGLREAIGRFGEKKYSSGRFDIVGPFYTENNDKSASFENRSSSVSYSGIIVKKGTTQPIEKFFLAGSLLVGSDYLNFRNAVGGGPANAKPGFTYDFSKRAPGEYEIILSNGLNFGNGYEDKEALQENIGLLAYTFIDKMLPVSDLIKKAFGTSSCFKAIASLLETETKIYFQANAGNLTPEWYVDVFTKLSKGVIKVLDDEKGCFTNENTRVLFRTAFRLFDLYDKTKKAYELTSTVARFGYDFVQYPSVVTLCKFVDYDNKVHNCFILQKVADSDGQRGYVCDTLSKPLVVQLVEDKKYYPDANPIEGFTVMWQKSDKSLATSKTNYDGYAELKEVMLTDQPGEQQTTASIARLDPNLGTIQQVTFKATAVRPALQAQTVNPVQTGSVGKKLTKPIIFSLTDGSPLNFVKLNRFTIQPEITGGGKLEPDPATTSPLFSGWNWTLGPAEGEQTVKFAITNKRCSPWPVQGNPVTFKATAIDPVITSVKITPDNPTVKKDQTLTLTATAYNAGGKEVPTENSQWQWGSDKPNIVSVAANGKQATVKGLAAGKANVTATETGSKSLANVSVTVENINQAISLNNTIWVGYYYSDNYPADYKFPAYLKLTVLNNLSCRAEWGNGPANYSAAYFDGVIGANGDLINWHSGSAGGRFTFNAPWTISGNTMTGIAYIWVNGRTIHDAVYTFTLTKQ